MPTAKQPAAASGDVVMSFLIFSDVSVTCAGALEADSEIGKIARQMQRETFDLRANGH